MKKNMKIRDAQGDYVVVAVDELFRATREAIDFKFKRGATFTDPAKSGEYCRAKLAGSDREVFGVLFLDTKHTLLAYEEIFFGTIDGAEVHPREVVKRALTLNASAIILTHNHPSGNPEPSAADRAVTTRLKSSLALIDVRVLDHIIVAGNSHTSMAMRGML